MGVSIYISVYRLRPASEAGAKQLERKAGVEHWSDMQERSTKVVANAVLQRMFTEPHNIRTTSLMHEWQVNAQEMTAISQLSNTGSQSADHRILNAHHGHQLETLSSGIYQPVS
jgi:hypothetical protein